jgi:hypothetical protein
MPPHTHSPYTRLYSHTYTYPPYLPSLRPAIHTHTHTQLCVCPPPGRCWPPSSSPWRLWHPFSCPWRCCPKWFGRWRWFRQGRWAGGGGGGGTVRFVLWQHLASRLPGENRIVVFDLQPSLPQDMHGRVASSDGGTKERTTRQNVSVLSTRSPPSSSPWRF